MIEPVQAVPITADKKIADIWTEMQTEKLPLMNRCELYSEWTLAWIFPPEHVTVAEVLPKSGGSIGARCVNHLSNHIVQILFPANRPFYRSHVGDKTKAMGEQMGLRESDLQSILARIEHESQLSTNIASHRNGAVDAMKHLIITGNACMYYYEDPKTKTRKAAMYDLRNYSVQRAWDGSIYRLCTRDTKKLKAFNAKTREIIKANKKGVNDETLCTLYTLIEWDADTQRYIVRQAADDVNLQTDEKITYPKQLLPWVALTWNRKHGENYGRGLVEDYEYSFNAHSALTTALDQMVAIMSDIKRFVNPTSVVDIDELNNSAPGTYHAAAMNDIWTPDMGKAYDIQAVHSRIQAIEQELGSAFMLSTATTRQAERVTAEEIKMQIRELEMSHGGIYSKFADEWQFPLATLILFDAGLGPDLDITPFVITGMDALSRSAESEAVYLVFNDLAVTQNLGTWGRWLDEEKYLQMSCANRGIDPDKLFKEAQVVAEEDQARMQAQAEMQQAEMQAKVAEQAMRTEQ